MDPKQLASTQYFIHIKTLPTGHFCSFLLFADFFFKIIFLEKFIQEYHQTFVGPDLDPNCLQKLSADDTSRKRANNK